MSEQPAFAADPATATYYERRAAEYDEWYGGEGIFAHRDRPGWHETVAALVALVASLPEARTVDVACGTAFVSMHLRGELLGFDLSSSMVAIARRRLGNGVAVGDALDLCVATRSCDRVFAGHFYGHLPPDERTRFLAEARRIGPELVVADSARRPDSPRDGWQRRTLNDGSVHRVYKRYFGAAQLAAELGGVVLLESPWFVVVRRVWDSPREVAGRGGRRPQDPDTDGQRTAARTERAAVMETGTTARPSAL
ncbi:MAG: class I SAM-dependent methyltransferase [Acidimicrobiales bacterium]